MIEILTFGNIDKDFRRLGVEIRQTYKGKEFGVCEVTKKEFEILCNDTKENCWLKCGWRYCVGSILDKPNKVNKVNNKDLICWHGLREEYQDLLSYIGDDGMGCYQARNVCALAKDLAKYNHIKLSELFKIYQEGM